MTAKPSDKKTSIPPPGRPPSGLSHEQYSLLLAAMAAAVALLVFIPTAGYQFIWDDLPLILENPRVTSPGGPLEAFNPDQYQFRINDQNVFYRPLTRMAFALEYAMWGSSPVGYHLINVLLHAVNTALVFGLILLLAGRRDWAFAAALLFAVHPVHVEAVAWIKCRSELMAFLFGVIAFMAAVQGLRNGRRIAWMAVACVLLLAALLSKQTALGLAPVLTAYAWMFAPAQRRREWLLWTVPLWIVAAGYAALDRMVLSANEQEVMVNGVVLNGFQRAALVIESLFLYVKWLAIPLGYSPHHDPSIPQSLAAWPWGKGVLLLLLAVAALCLAKARNWAGFALLWLLLALAPASNLLPIAGRSAAEQRAYLPSPGFCLAVAVGLAALANRLGKGRKRVALGILTIAIGALYAAQALSYSARWKEPLRFWEMAVQEQPGKIWMLRNYCAALIHSGQAARALDYLDRIVEKMPEDGMAWEQRGVALHDLGRLPEAVESLKKSMEMGRQSAMTAFRTGVCYNQMGRFAEAEPWFRKVLAAEPGFSEAELQLAGSLAGRGAVEEARALYQDLARRMPLSGAVRARLGALLSRMAKYPEAKAALEEGLALDPYSAELYLEKGRVCLLTGDATQAAVSLRQCVERSPGQLEAWLMLVQAHEQLGNEGVARKCLEQAEILSPESAEPSYLLGVWHLRRNEYREALASFERALQKNPQHAAARVGVGDVKQTTGGLMEAVKAYAQVSPDRPEYAEAMARKIEVLLRLNMLEEARDAAAAMLASATSSERFRLLAAQASLALHRPDEAWRLYEELKQSGEVRAGTQRRFARVFEQAGEHEKAMAIYREILAADPAEADTLDDLVEMAMSTRKPDLALPALEKALSVQPENAQWVHNLGVLHGLAGDLASAVEALKRAVALAPEEAQMQYSLAYACIEAKEHQAAEEACAALLRLEGESERGLYLSALIASRQNLSDITRQRLDKLLLHYPQNREGLQLRDTIARSGRLHEPDKAEEVAGRLR